MKKLLKLGVSIALVITLFARNGIDIDYARASEQNVGTVSDNNIEIQMDASENSEADTALQEIVEEQEILAAVYMSDMIPLREAADFDSREIFSMPCGTTVFIRGAVRAEDGTIWNDVAVDYSGQIYSGYIPRDNLACSDERYLLWEQEYSMVKPVFRSFMRLFTSSVSYGDVEQFPASYQPALRALKEAHPNWIFVPMNTGVDWQTAITAELQGGKSLVHKSFPAYDKEGAYDSGNWFYASEDILKLYMDPRNALQENAIFQFEQLTYNETYHTVAALDQFLAGTFMTSAQNAPNMDITYASFIQAIGADQRVSPFHLAARIYQEQGNGTSPLISGTYPGFEGYYNYFNVGATGTTNEQVIVSGLTYAKNHGWNSVYNAIEGGARVISANYILKGQDTLYLQKFNVNPASTNALFTHQYMQNISAPTSEALSIRNLYERAGALDSTFVFKIPVFNNMPETPCPMPTFSTNVVLQVPVGYDATVYLDGVAYPAQSRNGRYIVTAPNAAITNAVVYRYNENNVPVGMYVWTLDYANGAYTATAQPELTDLLTYHGFSIRITGKSGIRFKTGISTDLRARLLSDGVNGFHLREYGTLVMNNANRSSYPMVLGGQKVLSGLSYGVEPGGVQKDAIYETAAGRYRFTSVLVGLPANQYQVEYAFRGYIILEKNGSQTVIYGPAVAKSIYALADQVLRAGTYASGSEADQFLHKLITDADAVSATH
ncbi:MAG: hypothetical protein K6G30_07555 [Acetatifactor sp.]|nr:hypothetical protein [Acetatifactor sp.]